MLKEPAYYPQKVAVKIVSEPHFEKLDRANYVYFRLREDLVRFEVISEPVPSKTVVADLLNKTLVDVSLADYNEQTGRGAFCVVDGKMLKPGRIIDLARVHKGIRSGKWNHQSTDMDAFFLDISAEKSRGFPVGIAESPSYREANMLTREPRLSDEPMMFMITCYVQ